MTGENKFAEGTIHWCWSNSANAATTALILPDSGYKLTVDVLVEGRRVVKPKCDLYNTKEDCEKARLFTKNWNARQSQLDVAKKLFPVQPLPDGAIPYYLDEKEKQDDVEEEV